MTDFLLQLNGLLQGTNHISKEEVEEAIQLIKQRSWETNLRREGPCLICKTEDIKYGRPCPVHVSKGDTWLDTLFERWNKWPPRIKRRIRTLTINGYTMKTIESYICESCRADLDEQIAVFEEHEREEVARQRGRQLYYEIALINGKARGTPAKRFWALHTHITEQSKETLRTMPYHEFLSTIYWQIVRNYVLWKRDHACELCSSNESLNVHHKTYEHRGEEYLHLEDLIVLCNPCHAKFHDKLAMAA